MVKMEMKIELIFHFLDHSDVYVQWCLIVFSCIMPYDNSMCMFILYVLQ